MTGNMPQFPVPLETARRHRGRWIMLALLVLVVCGAAGAWWQRRESPLAAPDTPAGALPSDTSARAPQGVRVRVKVVNTTRTPRLAKRAALLLRDFGYDVVDWDTEATKSGDSTVIQVNAGSDANGERIRRVLGTGTVRTVRDPLRYVDVTVLLGRDWQAPAQPLRP
jgi:hypothetical protein